MIVLDTHAWIWWAAEPEKLSAKARDLVEAAAAEGEVYVSSISAWEVAMLVDRGRLRLSMDVEAWIALSNSLPALQFVPVDDAIAVRSIRLPDYRNRDPADRIIIATALTLGKTVITKDRKIRGYARVRSAW